NGANALLKLLEEPPEKTMLFLVASRPGRLPPTIRSRCRLVRIAPPDEALCRDVIAGHLSDIDASRAEDLARLAEGAPGRALSLAQSQSDDFYRATCALLAEPRFDMAAAATLCEKWGRGGAEGQPLRDGAIWLIGRLLRLAAVRAAGKENVASVVCAFEEEAISRLVSHHGAG
ncbi:MAG TPA: hypothetical protein DGU02_08215, partial [Alphaproteobacteria bacterium]|nr:hypothetical protein [Alphaproteobacteria bacterium]